MPQTPLSFTSKLPKTGTTIFTTMSALAAETAAVNLSQGFPDFAPDESLVQLVTKYMQEGKNQYAPMAGLAALREKIATKSATLYSASLKPETEVTVTAGATQAIFTAISAFVNRGDEVILFDPAYDCYEPAITLCGGKAVRLQLAYPDFSYDWNLVAEQISEKTRMLIINSPHNPSGKLLSAADLEALKAVTSKTNVLVLSDEVYEHILFDGYKHHSALSDPELAARSLVVSSFGKTYHNTGWKIGYCAGPASLMSEFRKVHQFNVFSVNTPAQFALADWMENETAYLELGKFYQDKRDHFLQLMADTNFEMIPTKGTYFQLADYSEISDLQDTDFAVWLTREHGVATIPISVFYENPPPRQQVVRFCFAKSASTLEAGAERLKSL